MGEGDRSRGSKNVRHRKRQGCPSVGDRQKCQLEDKRGRDSIKYKVDGTDKNGHTQDLNLNYLQPIIQSTTETRDCPLVGNIHGSPGLGDHFQVSDEATNHLVSDTETRACLVSNIQGLPGRGDHFQVSDEATNHLVSDTETRACLVSNIQELPGRGDHFQVSDEATNHLVSDTETRACLVSNIQGLPGWGDHFQVSDEATNHPISDTETRACPLVGNIQGLRFCVESVSGSTSTTLCCTRPLNDVTAITSPPPAGEWLGQSSSRYRPIRATSHINWMLNLSRPFLCWCP
ncbi:hypothetical protein J6590_035658 [Homalodisca vitripennis]|nr:hypothetical protein J6590_035658 [Homalodisca vitripennis]